MSHGIQIRLHLHPPQAEGESEPTARTSSPLPDVLPTASGNEHGAVFFNLDWQNQQAENLRQQVNHFLYNNAPPTLTETAHDIEPEKLPETVRDRAEQIRRQIETAAHETHRTVEQRKAEIETKTQTAAQTDTSPRENRPSAKHAESSAQTYAQPRGEQTAAAAHNQTSEPKTVREQINQTAAQTLPANNNRAEKPPANSPAVQHAPTETSEKSILTAGNLPSKTVPTNPQTAAAQSESATRDANNFSPKPANGNALFSETSTRVFNQSHSENAANNVIRHENVAFPGGALINGSAAAIEDRPQLENIQVGGFGAAQDFYDAAENVFAAGARGALMSAAVGSVVPCANGAVGGFLGFVSGIVSGTEIEPALRWLGSDKADAANNFPAAKFDEPNGENFHLQLARA